MRDQRREPPSSRVGSYRHALRLWFVIGAATALTACGGGGGGGGGNPAPNTPPANQAPQVNAGADQTIQFPTNNVSLTGSATDAAGSTLTYAWTSSPADGVTFATASAAQTTATFAAAGTYTLTLTVSDGALTGTDTVIITVQAAGNTAPTVNAGADQTIQLPTNQAQLSGSATDAENNTLTYAWTSDPAGVSFADAAAASTTATFPAAGTFTLTLTANDGQTTGSDSLTVVVQAAGQLFWPAPDTDENLPDRGWTRVTPAEFNMDAARLEQAATYALTAGGTGMIVKGGRLVHSWGDIDAKFASQSATKSIGGTLLGIAIEDGLVNLTDTAVSKISYIGNPPGTDDPARLGAITVLQLATHTAGFPKDGGYHPLQFDPGTMWSYSDGGLNWLADLLTNVFQQDLHALITAEVWADLGVNNGNVNNTDDITWRANSKRPTPPPGAPAVAHRELASGIGINSNAMARVGLLYLRNGMWSTRRILQEDFVNMVRTPRPEIAGLPNSDPVEYPAAPANYGVLWWTNAQAQMPSVPTDAYWAWGQYDSLIVVIPSLDLVIARIGPTQADLPGRAFGDGNWTADYAVLEPFLEPIVCAADSASSACAP
jgi:CubicO group peptidase (beta-lactamase class C family)